VLACNPAQILKRRVAAARLSHGHAALEAVSVGGQAGAPTRAAGCCGLRADLEKWRLIQSARICATLRTCKESAQKGVVKSRRGGRSERLRGRHGPLNLDRNWIASCPHEPSSGLRRFYPLAHPSHRASAILGGRKSLTHILSYDNKSGVNSCFSPATMFGEEADGPACCVWGNAARGIMRGPGLMSADWALWKEFGFTSSLNREATTLEFRWESFNFFNQTNLGLPDLYTDSSTAGLITSAQTPMRRMQFGLRLLW